MPATDELLLTRVSAIERDRFGRFLVLESALATVGVFDREGQLLRRFGRQGSGPGEFLRPIELVVRGDTILVSDYAQQRVSAFADDGTVLYTRRVPTPDGLLVSRLRPGRGGGWIGATTPRITNPRERSGHMVYVLSARAGAQSIDTVWRFDSGATTWAAPMGLPWGVAPSWFGATGAWAVLGEGRLAIVDGESGEVTVSDIETGTVRWRVRLGVVGERVAERDLRVVRDSVRARSAAAGSPRVSDMELSTPAVWSVADKVVSGGGDTLWVHSPLLSRDADRPVWFRVTPDAAVPHTLPLHFTLYNVWGDTLAGVVLDELDVPSIVGIRAR